MNGHFHEGRSDAGMIFPMEAPARFASLKEKQLFSDQVQTHTHTRTQCRSYA